MSELVPPPPPFSAASWLLGFIAAGVALCIGNLAGPAIGSNHGAIIGALCGAAPGAILAVVGARMQVYRAFGLGLLTGSCIMALLGGICGGMAGAG